MKHSRFRDMVYSITKQTMSGVHVSPGSAETLVGEVRYRYQTLLATLLQKNYQNRVMWVEVIVGNISVIF